ncbi:hypothetical protein ABZ299_25355 [Streptomyces sp. NPDC006184]|uniref:hypothetical protein n=1 Tax=Streptomyces sp. NPDC006184 TaxID=3155455 RepID=UPI0033AC771A
MRGGIGALAQLAACLHACESRPDGPFPPLEGRDEAGPRRLIAVGEFAGERADLAAASKTTTRLIALFKMTAESAANPKRLISSGRRNSAPPSPIIPPSTPMAAPAPNTTGVECVERRGASFWSVVTVGNFAGAVPARYGTAVKQMGNG